MGFRTLAIEQRSAEVWNLLGAVRTEFSKFGQILEKTSKKLQEAGNHIDAAAVRTRSIEKKLRGVQEMPAAEAAALLESEPWMKTVRRCHSSSLKRASSWVVELREYLSLFLPPRPIAPGTGEQPVTGALNNP